MSTNSDSDAPDYSSYYYDQYKVAVYTNLFTGIVCGTYIVLYATSVYVLLRHPGFTSSRPRMIMFGTTTFMFILGIIALVLATTIMFQEMLSVVEQVSDGGASLASYLAWAILTRLMYILCDIICAWRTVVLWNRDKRVIAILLIFILGTTVASVFAYGIALESELEPGTSNAFDLVMVCPTLATNLLSTGLIAWKAWKRRISIRKHLFERSGFARVDRIFALLIESGLIYCCIWILYLISLFGVLPNPGFTAMAFISGLYPTLIIIFVGLQRSPVEHYSTHSTGMRFASGSKSVTAPGLPMYDSMPQHGISIHREYSSDFDTQISSTVMNTFDDENNLLP